MTRKPLITYHKNSLLNIDLKASRPIYQWIGSFKIDVGAARKHSLVRTECIPKSYDKRFRCFRIYRSNQRSTGCRHGCVSK